MTTLATATELNSGTLDDLLTHLNESGTPDSFLERINGYADDHPDEATPRHIFEWARATWQPWEKGTLSKIGRWLYGDDYREVDPSVLPSTREEQLLAELKQEKEAHRETSAQRNREMAFRRSLQDENDRLRALLNNQSATLSAVAEQHPAIDPRTHRTPRRGQRRQPAPPPPSTQAVGAGAVASHDSA